MFSTRNVASACAAVAFSLGAQSAALAQASGDGWQGPRAFGDAALNEALLAMNDLLQARYANDAIMASLNEPPQSDFVTVARAVSDVPELASIRIDYGFGPAITDGRSLQLHLASFNEDLDSRGDALFIRVARASGGTGLDFAEVGGVPPVPGDEVAFGPEIWDNVTLDEHMSALFDHMIEHAGRSAELSVANPDENSGSSFDRYSESLSLY